MNKQSIIENDTHKSTIIPTPKPKPHQVQYDNKIAPMMYQEGSDFNKYWGYISRGGFGDKVSLSLYVYIYIYR